MQRLPRGDLRHWVLLLLLTAPSAEPSWPGPSEDDVQHLEARVQQLRSQLRERIGPGAGAPADAPQSYAELYMPLLELATLLQQLNHQNPDGGRRLPEAEAAYRAVLAGSHAPSALAHIHSNLAALLLAGERADDALVELKAAATYAEQLPRSSNVLPGILFNKGKALSMAGRLAAADEAYVAAAKAADGVDCASYGKALAAMRRLPDGMLERAQEVAAQGMRALAALQSTAFLRHVINQWPAPLPSASSKAAPSWIASCNNTDLSWLHFALWKHFDRAGGDAALAWAHVTTANRLMRVSVAYSPSKDRQLVRDVRSAFSAGAFELSSGYVNATLASPIFVVGLPRSGSTLLEQLLGSHSWVWAAGEDTAFAPLVGEMHDKLLYHTDREAYPALLTSFGRRYLEAMRARVPPDAEQRIADAVAAFERAHGAASGGGVVPGLRIVDKMLRNLWLLGHVRLLLPSACVLLMERHPLDAALSCYAQPFGYAGVSWAWDTGHIAAQVEMAAALTAHWDSVLPGWVQRVMYEELVAKPEAVARRVLAACGLPWEAAVLDFHQHAKTRPVATASMAQVREPLYSSSVGRWRRYRQQLQPLVERLQPLVAAYEVRLAEAGCSLADDDNDNPAAAKHDEL